MNQKRRPKRARKSNKKAKKTKFLSLLRLQFPAEESTEENKLRSTDQMRVAPDHSNSSQQLNLFPLHPENDQVLQDHREINNDHENVDYFFSAADGGATTTLTALLDESTATASISSHATIDNSSRQDDLSPSPASLSYAYRSRQDSEDRAALVRNALRNRERDSGEEKWICYSELVEKVIKEEEVTSSAVDLRRRSGDRAGTRRLSLKLDYQEILNAWSDKGPLYIHAESSQIVPDMTMMNDDFLAHEASHNGMGLWTVPEIVGDIDDDNTTNNETRLKNEAELRIGQREASVLRYKEKRRNRLVEKKIRYQVRKINAEKRPRLKGRFVKRS